jgi:hypothetical protein
VRLGGVSWEERRRLGHRTAQPIWLAHEVLRRPGVKEAEVLHRCGHPSARMSCNGRWATIWVVGSRSGPQGSAHVLMGVCYGLGQDGDDLHPCTGCPLASTIPAGRLTSAWGLLVSQVMEAVLGFFSQQDEDLLDACPHRYGGSVVFRSVPPMYSTGRFMPGVYWIR